MTASQTSSTVSAAAIVSSPGVPSAHQDSSVGSAATTMGVTRRQPPSAAAQNSNGSASKSHPATSPSSTMSAANHHLHHHNPVPDAAADIPSPKYMTPTWVKATLLLFCLVTVLAWPGHWHPLDRQASDETSVRYVFFYGWLTALSTGLGVLPFALLPDVADYWVGISNGM